MIKIGNICKDKYGRLGVVTKIIAQIPDYLHTVYRGIPLNDEGTSLNDGSDWQTTKPEFVAESISQHIEDQKELLPKG